MNSTVSPLDYATIATEETAPPLNEFWDRLAAVEKRLAGWVVNDTYCLNPRCDCRTVILRLEGMDDRPSVTLLLPFDGSEPTVQDPAPAGGSELLIHLLCVCGARFWDEARRRYGAVKEYGRQHPERYLRIERGQCVPYFDIVPDEAILVEFLQDGQRLRVYDQYCPVPECHCQEALLDVHRLREVEPGKWESRSFVVFWFDLRNRKGRGEGGAALTSRDRKLLEAIRSRLPDMARLLQRRYDTVKEFGRKLEQHGGLIEPEPKSRPWRLR